MRKILLLTAVSVLAACGENGLSAEQKQERGREAVRLFAASCVAHRGGAAETAAWAGAQKAQALSEDDVKKLPLGMMEFDLAAAWKIEKNGAAYYLSLAPESCSVKTEKADADAVRQAFSALVQAAPQGLNAELRSDRAVQTPFPFSQLAYAWRAPGSPEEWVLTANTSPSEQLPAQAVLSLTRQVYQRKPLPGSD